MITAINPKLPMRNRDITRQYYEKQLGFTCIGSQEFMHYLIMQKDEMQIHFFEFATLEPTENYGQVYIRTNAIDELFQTFVKNGTDIHPNGHLKLKPWGQKEFSILDPDHNLLTFGQTV